jgi:hypothetical protein
MKRIFGLLLLAALVVSAAGTDVSGKWTGKFAVNTPDGPKEESAYMVLKQMGAQVTGTAGPDEGQQWPITEGKADGNKISFKVQSEGPLFAMALVLENDHLKGDATATMQDQTLTAKLDVTRVKE